MPSTADVGGAPLGLPNEIQKEMWGWALDAEVSAKEWMRNAIMERLDERR
jgi:hypothetical protein